MQSEIKRHSRQSPWDYALLDRRQRELAGKVREGKPGVVLLSELAPVITMGKRAGEQELLEPLQSLQDAGISLYSTDRGGLATYHGPGQWVLFVVESLEKLTGNRRGVRTAVNGLLQIAHQVSIQAGVRAEIKEGCHLGLWSPRGKLASVGIHVERGVLLHGLALNVYRTQTSFRGLRPCGLDEPVDFLLQSPDDSKFEQIGEMILQATAEVFPELGSFGGRL